MAPSPDPSKKAPLAKVPLSAQKRNRTRAPLFPVREDCPAMTFRGSGVGGSDTLASQPIVPIGSRLVFRPRSGRQHLHEAPASLARGHELLPRIALSKMRLYLVCSLLAAANASILDYASFLGFRNWTQFVYRTTDNELWRGLAKDCEKRVGLSCIQKNAFTYLDNTFQDGDNITVFEGLVLRRNDLDYQRCAEVNENLIDAEGRCEDEEEDFQPSTPLSEIVGALRSKVVRFMATRDYEVTLPEFFFEGSNLRISPKEVDERGALIRVDFGLPSRGGGRFFGVEDSGDQGRIFKKISKCLPQKCRVSWNLRLNPYLML